MKYFAKPLKGERRWPITQVSFVPLPNVVISPEVTHTKTLKAVLEMGSWGFYKCVPCRKYIFLSYYIATKRFIWQLLLKENPLAKVATSITTNTLNNENFLNGGFFALRNTYYKQLAGHVLH